MNTCETISYYELVRVDVPPPKSGDFIFVSAAVMSCLICGRMIDGMGGPGEAICIPCGDVIKSHQAQGAIKWGEHSPKGEAE